MKQTLSTIYFTKCHTILEIISLMTVRVVSNAVLKVWKLLFLFLELSITLFQISVFCPKIQLYGKLDFFNQIFEFKNARKIEEFLIFARKLIKIDIFRCFGCPIFCTYLILLRVCNIQEYLSFLAQQIYQNWFFEKKLDI